MKFRLLRHANLRNVAMQNFQRIYNDSEQFFQIKVHASRKIYQKFSILAASTVNWKYETSAAVSNPAGNRFTPVYRSFTPRHG